MSVGAFFLCSLYISSLHAERFSSASTARKQDHMTIILYSDLTTSLTIIRTGVHGDKSVREYEKAVFAYQKGLEKATTAKKRYINQLG